MYITVSLALMNATAHSTVAATNRTACMCVEHDVHAPSAQRSDRFEAGQNYYVRQEAMTTTSTAAAAAAPTETIQIKWQNENCENGQ